MNYFGYVFFKRVNSFTRALACFGPKWRFKVPKRLWMALRLGLYKTVIVESTLWSSKRTELVRLVAKIKRIECDQQEVHRELLRFLLSSKYLFFRDELIKETIYLEPSFYLEYFKKNITLLNDKKSMIWYLALADYHDIDISDISEMWSVHIEKHAPLLYSNVAVINQSSKLDILNNQLREHYIAPVSLYDMSKGVSVRNVYVSENALNSETATFFKERYQPKVSILVTVYNSGSIVKTAIYSLLSQTWDNVEIVIINDASTDDSLEIIKQIASQEEKVVVVDLPKNIGTFSAKNIGAKFATGDFLTCHDSDDWAHPQKIEAQIKPLLSDESLIATTSQWVRLDQDGRYHVRQVYPYVQQNPASILFRRNKIISEVGFWHNVRTGADSEFIERLKLIYGRNSIKLIKGVLTLGSYREDSLTTSKVYGAYTKQAVLKRLDYWESWRLWHLEQIYNKKNIYMPLIDELSNIQQPMIDVPSGLTVNIDDILFNLKYLKTHNV